MTDSRLCEVGDCGREARGRGRWCNLHRQRARTHGDPTATVVPTLVERFMAKVNQTAACWIWTANLAWTGYGLFSWGAKGMRSAHRVAYELFVGPIPAGLQIDHLCRNRACVNPAHLEAVTARENVRRRDLAKLEVSL